MTMGIILIVDEHEGVRRLIGEALRGRGYSVVETATGGAAVDFAQASFLPIALLVTEVVLADLPGTALFDLIRATLAGMKARVLFTCGSLPPGFSAPPDFISVGPCLKKPFELQDLYRAVEILLQERKRTAQELSESNSA